MDTIVFDCDGVIANTEELWDRNSEKFFRKLGLVYKRDEIKHLMTGKTVRESCGVVKEKYSLSISIDEMEKMNREGILRLIEAEAAFVPGFMEFYDKVRGTFKTAVATSNVNAMLEAIDSRLQLRKLFEGHVYNSAMVGYKGKPAPDIFLFAAQKLGSKPADCMVIEDAPIGIEAARNAGMASVGLVGTYKKELLAGADFIANDFDEILSIIESRTGNLK